LNPLTVALGVQNASFIAQAVDWVPELLYDIVRAAYHHKGFSFVRIVQRCPEWLPELLDPWVQDPRRTRLLTHKDGLTLNPGLARVYTNQCAHDPADLDAARRIAADTDTIPVGILYRNPGIPCYEDLRRSERVNAPNAVKACLDAELDKLTV